MNKVDTKQFFPHRKCPPLTGAWIIRQTIKKTDDRENNEAWSYTNSNRNHHHPFAWFYEWFDKWRRRKWCLDWIGLASSNLDVAVTWLKDFLQAGPFGPSLYELSLFLLFFRKLPLLFLYLELPEGSSWLSLNFSFCLCVVFSFEILFWAASPSVRKLFLLFFRFS